MTAPEPTPAAEHIDAVARAMNPPTFRAGPVDGPRASAQKVIRARAESLLASTDPAVHAAMLDALVRAGVLTVEDAPIYRAAEHHHWQQRWDGEHTHEGRRHVTRWEVAP